MNHRIHALHGIDQGFGPGYITADTADAAPGGDLLFGKQERGHFVAVKAHAIHNALADKSRRSGNK